MTLRTNTHASTKAAPPTKDAVDSLMADHKRVKSLFKKFEGLKEKGSAAEKAAVVEKICQELTIHATVEEEIFYPAVREKVHDDDLMDEALVEHAGAKDLIAQLEGIRPSEDLYDAKVTVLGEQIDHHVEEEESEMFPKARKARIDLVSTGMEMEQRRTELKAELGIGSAGRSNAEEDSEE